MVPTKTNRLRLDSIEKELEYLAAKGGGVLKPEAVVTFAKNPETNLHRKFTWDDAAAAHAHRLWQARRLIKCYVIVEPRTNAEVSTFVSLTTDRGEGGYRRTLDVLGDFEMKAQLILDARREMHRFIERYRTLERLAPVFDAMQGVLDRPESEAN